jgi:membrane protein DedA with SNARE-associated domain
VLMVLESSSLPIPSEIILPFSGYLVSLGTLNFWLVVTISTIAGLAGSLIDYTIGMKCMDAVVNSKTGRLLLSKSRLEIVKRWYEKYRIITVFGSRLIPGFRTLASFPAGAVKMPLKEFVAYTFAGCLTWDVLLTSLGFYVGSNWAQIAGIIRNVLIGFSLALMLGLAAFLLWRNAHRWRKIAK